MAIASARTAHTVPAQLHVEIEPAADDVQMIVDQPGQRATTLQIDDPCRGAGERHHVFIAPDCGEDAIRDGDRAGGGIERSSVVKRPFLRISRAHVANLMSVRSVLSAAWSAYFMAEPTSFAFSKLSMTAR